MAMPAPEPTPTWDDTAGFPALEADFVRRLVPSFDWVHCDSPSPRNPLRIPLARARVGLVTTAGAHLPGQDPPGRRGEARLVPLDAPQVVLTHPGYDTERASADPEVVVPARTLPALAGEGLIGEVAPVGVSTMGFVPDGACVGSRSVPVAVEALADQEVDLALLVPA